MRQPARIPSDGQRGGTPPIWLLLCALSVACGGTARTEIETRADVRDDDLPQQLHQGFAFAPTWITGSRLDAVELGAQLTQAVSEQVSTDLFLAGGVLELVSAERVRELLPAGRPAEALATLRRQRAAGQPLDASVARAVADPLGRRLLLATWLSEDDERGVQILHQEQPGAPWPPDGGTVPYTQVRGSLTGELIDLQIPRVVWRGVAAYRTERGSPARVRAELVTLRQKAVASLSRALTAP